VALKSRAAAHFFVEKTIQNFQQKTNTKGGEKMYQVSINAGPAGGYILKIGCHERLLHRKESVLVEIEAHLSDSQTATREYDEYKRMGRVEKKSRLYETTDTQPETAAPEIVREGNTGTGSRTASITKPGAHRAENERVYNVCHHHTIVWQERTGGR